MSKHLKRAVISDDETTQTPCRLTYHGMRRAAQRNLSPDELTYTLAHARRVRRTGVIFCFLGSHDLPACDRYDEWARRLVGTVLIIEDGFLITAYRNPHALRVIKRKMKYRLSPEQRAGFPVCASSEEVTLGADNDDEDERDERWERLA